MSLENQPQVAVEVTPPTDVQPKVPFLSDDLYNKLKWFTLIVLPAFGTFYFTFGQVWGLPNPTGVVASCAALATFLGSLLGVATKNFNNSDAVNHVGTLNVSETDDVKTYLLDLGNTDPAVIDRSSKIVLDVNR